MEIEEPKGPAPGPGPRKLGTVGPLPWGKIAPPSLLELALGGDRDALAAWQSEMDEAAARRERERQERARLEAMPPLVVLYTVHGTFARGAPWTRPDSGLCLSLRQALGWRVKVVPVDWSGRNLVRARAAGAAKLRAALEAGLREHPDADHFVIAHSHGGNVALSALADSGLARRVQGVITLATPFLSARVVEGEALLDPFTAFFASLFAGWCVLFAGAYQGHGWSWWPGALGMAAAVLAVLLVGMWLASRMQACAQRLAKDMPATALREDQLAVVRVEGDEAIATLAGARFAGAAVRMLWRVLTARLFRVVGSVLAFVDYGGWRKTSRELEERVWKRDELVLRTPLAKPLQTPGPWETAKPLLWQALPVLMVEAYRSANHATQLAILALMGLYGVPAVLAMALVVLSVPIGVLTSISLLPCGWTVPLAGPFLQVTAEPSPRGTWNVSQFEGTFGERGLDHSHAYQARAVWSFAAGWIGARCKAPAAASAPPSAD